MGAVGIVERYSQVRPTVFVCDTVVKYSGKQLDLRQRFSEVNKKLRESVPELKCSIVINGPSFVGTGVKLAKDCLNPTATALSYVCSSRSITLSTSYTRRAQPVHRSA